MDIEKNFHQLQESPTYAMSLGGKELFHSNFWAWFIEQNQQFVTVFLPDGMEKPNKVTVTREEKNRDLTLYLDDKIFIVENKIKSLPTKEQLEKYAQDYQESQNENSGGTSENPIGVLTGLPKEGPDFLADIRWDYLSYAEISKKIREIANDLKEKSHIKADCRKSPEKAGLFLCLVV